jgi:hypothetical protein
MVHDNDRTSLEVVPAPRTGPQPLGDTLSNGTTVAVAAAPGGSLAIVRASPGTDADRVYWQSKQIEVCDPQFRVCTPPSTPTSTVTVDPSWSPDGTTLAFAEAPGVAPSTPFDQSAVAGVVRRPPAPALRTQERRLPHSRGGDGRRGAAVVGRRQEPAVRLGGRDLAPPGGHGDAGGDRTPPVPGGRLARLLRQVDRRGQFAWFSG